MYKQQEEAMPREMKKICYSSKQTEDPWRVPSIHPNYLLPAVCKESTLVILVVLLKAASLITKMGPNFLPEALPLSGQLKVYKIIQAQTFQELPEARLLRNMRRKVNCD